MVYKKKIRIIYCKSKYDIIFATQQRRGTAIFESRKGLLSFFSWCCGFFMIGYVVFLSRSFSFFYSSSHSYQILENVIFCSGGL